MRTELTAYLRWEKYTGQQATDQVLRDLFQKNPDVFDGTMVRARHILLSPKAGDAQAAEQAKAQLRHFKQQIEEEAAQELTKLPAGTDNQAREQEPGRKLAEAVMNNSRHPEESPHGRRTAPIPAKQHEVAYAGCDEKKQGVEKLFLLRFPSGGD